MSYEICFQGGHIFNPGYYPANVNTQSKPVLRAMGKNVRLDYSLVDEAGAARDLDTEGFFLDPEAKALNIPQLEALPLSSDLVHRFATGLNNLTNDFVKDYYVEDIVVERGYDVFRSLAQHTLDNQVAEYTDNFFSSSYRSEGRYFSYQMAFYSMKRVSYCFMVFSMISYKNVDYVFGIPVSV